MKKNKFLNKHHSYESNSLLDLWKKCLKWINDQIKTIFWIFLIYFLISLIACIVSIYNYENKILVLVVKMFFISYIVFGILDFIFLVSKSKTIIDLFKSCWKWIETNVITILFSLSFIFVFLYFEKELVEASFLFINKIKESTYGIILLWIFWGILLAILIYWIVFKYIHKTLSDGRAFFVSILLCSLFVYCWTEYPWIGIIDPKIENPIEGREWACIVLFVMYALCFFASPFILYLIVKTKIKKYSQESSLKQKGNYLSDTPITSVEQDELRFGDHVKALRNKIDEIPNTGTHSIAITGGWGTGKTSFLNLLELELKDSNQYEIMWFNPMKSSKSGNIQNDFFDALENTLSKYKTGFGHRIKYYKELIGAIDNKYVAFLVKLGSIQLEEEKNRINDIIKMIPKKVIIIIDDVDRLKGDEIIQVFRLVGFNAKFDNVVFLIALDKGNVVKALNCDFNYPDKFFETDFPLPDNNRKATSLFVKNTIRRLLADIPMVFLDDQDITKYTNYCLSNLRDATRFINGFVDRVRMIYNKLDVCSFYLLSLIRYKSPSLYEQIKSQEFLENKVVDGEQRFVLKEDFSLKNPILTSIMHQLFSKNTNTDSGHYIFQPDYFDDYFNDSSTQSITDAIITKLLLSKSEIELQQLLNRYANNEISKQNLIDSWKTIKFQSFINSLSVKNEQARLITNYYRVFYYLKIDNGLQYSDGLAINQIAWNEYACVDNLGFVVFIVKYDEVSSFHEGLACVRKHDKCGFIDKDGNIVVPLEYDDASGFSEGRACVKKRGKYGFIDKDGNIVVHLEYDDALIFHGECAIVKKESKYGYIDKDGNIIVPLELDDISDFSEDLTRVKKDGKYGLIDNNGNIVAPLEYDDVWDFREGLACVKKDGKYGLINKIGNIVAPLEYDDVSGFREGLSCVKKEGKYGFIDKDGNIVVPLEYDDVRGFREGLARVKKDGKYGYIDKNGSIVVPWELDDTWTWSFSEGLALIKKDGKYGYMNKEGIVIPLEYDGACDFSEGRALVEKHGKYGFIDKNGKIIVPLEYDDAGMFSGKRAVVKKDSKYGYIDKDGNIVIPLEYDGAGKFYGERAIVEKEGAFCIIDNNGNIVVHLEYDDVWSFREGLARVKKDGKYGFIDRDGNIVVPLEYDDAWEFSEGRARVEKRGKYGFIDKDGNIVVPLEHDDNNPFRPIMPGW